MEGCGNYGVPVLDTTGGCAITATGVAAVAICIGMVGVARHVCGHSEGPTQWKKISFSTVPTLLLIVFCVTPSTSTKIFAAWTCESFQLDSREDPPTKVLFLTDDQLERVDDKLCIEVCPSSNEATLNLDHLSEHPLLRRTTTQFQAASSCQNSKKLVLS